MLNKEEEIGCFELIKNNFPDLNGGSLVIGLYEFLTPEIDLKKYLCLDQGPKQAVIPYIQADLPYVVMDESEGYKCLFLKGRHIKAHYDVSRQVMIRFIEESDSPAEPTP